MPPVLVVRHGSAGSRTNWAGADDRRPLDRSGHRQSAALVEMLAGYRIDRILSSPYLRCSETVAPLAAARDLDVELCPELAEGSQRTGLEALLGDIRGSGAVLCSHGDVIGKLVGPKRHCPKGSVWVLEWDGEQAVPSLYIKPRG